MVGSGATDRSKEAVGMMALHEALRTICLNTDWTYSVFWTIRPRPRVRGGTGCKVGDDNGSLMLMWEDGFCRGRVSSDCLEEIDREDPVRKAFSKMSIQLYNYGEGLMGKVASDKCHKWVFKEPTECEPNISNYWQSSYDALPPEWTDQFESGIQTIAVIQAGHGLLQLGSCKIIPEDLHFVLRMRHTFESLGYQSGFYLSQLFSSNRNNSGSSVLPSMQSPMPIRPPPPLFNWAQRPLPSAATMQLPSPNFQNSAARLGYNPQASKDETHMFLLPHTSETQMGGDMMGGGGGRGGREHESDIKWPNGLSFFNALTGRSDDAKLLFNPGGSENKGGDENHHHQNSNANSDHNEFLSLDCHLDSSARKNMENKYKRSFTLPARMASSSSNLVDHHQHQPVGYQNAEAVFMQFGAFPVFVLDGTPSPLKSQARIARFFRSSGIDSSSLPVAENGVSAERNSTFTKYIQECVELLELLGMPVLKAKGEAEALCAQLNGDGHVDACITSDSDAFLFGAKCVIKTFRSNSKEPFECFYMSDIEAGLGLKRNHLIALSLLAGNDHDLNGVQGIGLDTALLFAQTFSEDEILNRLCEIGNGDASLFQGGMKSVDDSVPSFDESSSKTKCSHCSFCGHPGSKRAHFKSSCEFCSNAVGEGCMKRSEGFKCSCSTCDMDRKEKKLKKYENWRLKVLSKIALEPNFPNDEIIEMYLCNNHGCFNESDGPSILWESPKTEMLVEFLTYHQRWEPSYIRQRMLPMLSTIFLREMAKNPVKKLLYGQYEFNSINRLKIRYGHQYYVVKWKKTAPTLCCVSYPIPPEESDIQQDDVMVVDESFSSLDESDVPTIDMSGGCCFLLTDENMDLVHAAFPEEVGRFLLEKELKEMKRRKATGGKPETAGSKGVQLNITEFFRSAKKQYETEPGEDLTQNTDSQIAETGKEKRSPSSSNLPKSVRRRLLFD